MRSPVASVNLKVPRLPNAIVPAVSKMSKPPVPVMPFTPNLNPFALVEPVPRIKLPVVVAPPEIVRPPPCVPSPIVDDAAAITP